MPVIALLIGAVLAAADQLFKMLIVNNFTLGETRPLIPNILNLTYIRNEGVAFGMFSGMSWLFIVLTVLLLSFIIFYMFRKRPDSKLFYFSVALVIGGGLGNLIDRFAYGYVGVVLLAIYLLFFADKKKKEKKHDGA